jgi:formylglycine-generating enzyme required for sulfatase activity
MVNGDKWGATLDGTKANYMNSGDAYDNGTTPIGYFNGLQIINGKKQGSVMLNDYGLFDMSGNVYEWCWNRFGEYSADTHGPDVGKHRVIRGGSWRSTEALHLTSVFRNYTSPGQRSDSVGFRCVRRL